MFADLPEIRKVIGFLRKRKPSTNLSDMRDFVETSILIGNQSEKDWRKLYRPKYLQM